MMSLAEAWKRQTFCLASQHHSATLPVISYKPSTSGFFVSTGTIGNIECGLAKPSFDLLVTLANVLGIHPAQLLHDEASPDVTTEQTSAEHTLLMEIYTRIKNNFVPDHLMK